MTSPALSQLARVLSQTWTLSHIKTLSHINWFTPDP